MGPDRLPRIAVAEMQDHSPATAFYPAADLDQAQAECVHLDSRQQRGWQPTAQPPSAGRLVQQQPELVGHEPMAGKPIGLQRPLDVELGLAAINVVVVDRLRLGLAAAGDRKASIADRRQSAMQVPITAHTPLVSSATRT